MHSERGLAALSTIRETIRPAFDFVADLDESTFAGDRKSVFAVIRCLEIISEASRRIDDDVKARHPETPWAQIAGAGNVYRHEYDNVLESYVWVTVQNSLAHLLTVVDIELENSEN